MTTGGEFDTSAALNAKNQQLFSALTQLNFDLIDKEKELATVTARADGHEDAIRAIVEKIEAAMKPGKKIKPKDFILDIYRIAMTSAVKFAPDPKAQTTRLVNSKS